MKKIRQALKVSIGLDSGLEWEVSNPEEVSTTKMVKYYSDTVLQRIAECLQFLQRIPYMHHIDLFTCRHVLGAMVMSEMVGTPTSVSTGNLQIGLSNLLLSLVTLPQSSSVVPHVSSSKPI